MNIGDTLHGFRLDSREPVDEIHSEALRFTHLATGADLVVLSNDDDNKVFLIAFKTPPSDDTGLPHILEHSVLAGSRQFPTKEPFADMLRGSLYTFLNAMTFPEKTVYPVASRNAQDFHNLMDVYLDAVFHPLLKRETFQQEGWHYEVPADRDEVNYSGVVYNEMLGVYSDPESLLDMHIERTLFPGSPYGCNAGGDPSRIPELSYEAFCAFHRRYYHPSNSRIVLYGDFDVGERLAHLQRYLQDYAQEPPAPGVAPPTPLPEPVQERHPYPVNPDEATGDKTWALRTWLLSPTTDPFRGLALHCLGQILLGNTGAPLRKALIDAHLADDTLDWGVDDHRLYPVFAVGLKGMRSEDVPAMHEVIDKTLQQLAAEGLPPRGVEAVLNSTEFMIREANFGGMPKGLVYGLHMMLGNWLHGGDPLGGLRYEPLFERLRQAVAEGDFFEELIRSELLANPHQSTIVLEPDEQLEARRLQALREQLASFREGLSDGELEELRETCRTLREAQAAPDRPEDLAKLPRLPVDYIQRGAESFPLEEVADEPVPITFCQQPTNGIAYVRLLFDADCLPAELVPTAALFSDVLLQLGTAKRDYVDLLQELGIQTGSMHASYEALTQCQQPEQVQNHLVLGGKVLKQKLPAFFGIAAEVLGSARFDLHERLLELCQMRRSAIESSVLPAGHRFALSRIGACLSRGGEFGEATGGLRQYISLLELERELREQPEAAVARFRRLASLLFRRGHCRLHVTGGRAELNAARSELGAVLDVLGAGREAPQTPRFAPVPRNEGLMTPAKIQFAGKGVNLYAHGHAYHGAMDLLSKYFARDYLWNRVRIQGGAYGCFLRFDPRSGNLIACSFRDPNLRQTLATYDGMVAHLQHLDMDRETFEKLLIGTVGGIDAPKSEEQKGSLALRRHLTGVSQEWVQARREELLGCTVDDLRGYAEAFAALRDHGTVCVVGSAEKIRAEADCFETIHNALDD